MHNKFEIVAPINNALYEDKAIAESKALLSFFEYPEPRYIASEIREHNKAKEIINNVLRHDERWDESRHHITFRTEVEKPFDPTDTRRFRTFLMHIDANGGGIPVTEEQKSWGHFLGLICDAVWGEEQFANEVVVENANALMEQMGGKPVFKVGQKQSRIINAICTQVGINKINWTERNLAEREVSCGYNKLFAAYADSLNLIKRNWVVNISTNINDYLGMSLGTNWASCHTIDKKNILGYDKHYNGCYSAGTMSYAMDKVSFVVTLTPVDYQGEDTQLCLKQARCMFFFDPENRMLGQSRVYPYGRDGGDSLIARQMRNIVQLVIADCLDVPNLWKVKNGTSVYDEHVISSGLQYEDYFNYDDVNISFLNEEKPARMRIGTDTRCLKCDEWLDDAECIFCRGCMGDARCDQCGDYFDSNDHGYVSRDGEYAFCCRECLENAGWCTPIDSDYIRREDDCRYCEANNEYYYYTDDGADTVDGDWFPNDDTAEYYGYVFCVDVDQYAKRSCAYRDADNDEYYLDECGDGVTTNDGKWYHDAETAERCGYVWCEDDALYHHVEELGKEA